MNKFKNIFNKITCKITYGMWTINSGTYIGYVKDIKNILYDINSNPNIYSENDDQIQLIKYYKQNKNIFYIDKKSEFFLVIIKPLVEITPSEIEKYDAFFLHGPGFTDLNKILEKHGYNPPYSINNDLKHSYKKRYDSSVVHFIGRHIIKIVIGLIIASVLILFYFNLKIIFK